MIAERKPYRAPALTTIKVDTPLMQLLWRIRADEALWPELLRVFCPLLCPTCGQNVIEPSEAACWLCRAEESIDAASRRG